MQTSIIKKILANEEFHKLARKKAILGWVFSLLIFVIYVAYITFIGLGSEIFSTPVKEGATTTWGIYIGLFVILFAVLVTGIYIYKANGEFEDITQKIVKDASEDLS